MNDICFIVDVVVLLCWLKVCEVIDFVVGVYLCFDCVCCECFLVSIKFQLRQCVCEFFKGMIVQLYLVLVMVIDVKVFVLDELILGLDIFYCKEFYQCLLEDYFDEQKIIIVIIYQVEEIEYIFIDVMFICDGCIVLIIDMENIGECYIELLVLVDMVELVCVLKLIDECVLLFGKIVLLFDGVLCDQFIMFGEICSLGLVDLFVVIMKGIYV